VNGGIGARLGIDHGEARAPFKAAHERRRELWITGHAELGVALDTGTAQFPTLIGCSKRQCAALTPQQSKACPLLGAMARLADGRTDSSRMAACD
jgi:hypothetical protein